MTIEIPEGYESLGFALGEAVAQASRGKGADRHAERGEPFSDQLIMSIPRRLGPGGECFCLGQALKKICESRRLAPAPARAELLGAINYLAAAWSLLGGTEGALKERASRLIARGGTVPAPKNTDIYADPSVVPLRKDPPSAPEDADMPRFQKGELVECRLPDGTWKPARFAFMDGGRFVLDAGEERFGVLGFEVRKADVAGPSPEDADEPLFAVGGRERYAVGERVKYAVDGKWESGAYAGVDSAGKHVVCAGNSFIHLDGSLVTKA